MVQEKQEEKKKVIADWSVDLYVNCPHCNNYFDILDEFQEQSMFEVADVCETKDISYHDFEVKCDKCKKEFKIDEVQH